MKRMAVFISGSGSNLQTLIDEVEKGSIKAEIGLVVSNRRTAYGLERAEKHGIATITVQRSSFTSCEEMDQAILSELRSMSIDFIVLAGYLSILSPVLINAFPNRIINIHPSLIPAFCGMGYYGLRVHQAAIDYGVKVTGATVHFVDAQADTGPIILQQTVLVDQDDDAESLQRRVLEIEHRLLPKATALFAEDKLIVDGRHVRITE